MYVCLYVKCVHLYIEASLGLCMNVGNNSTITITMKQHDKHVEEEGTCFRVGQQVMCRPSLPVTNKSLTMETPTGPKRRPIYASLSQPMCVWCVCRCMRQAAIVNAVLQFTFLIFCFPFFLPLHWASLTQFRNYAFCNFIFFFFSPLDPILSCYRNFEMSSFFFFFSFVSSPFFFLFQPRLGQTRRDQLVFTLP